MNCCECGENFIDKAAIKRHKLERHGADLRRRGERPTPTAAAKIAAKGAPPSSTGVMCPLRACTEVLDKPLAIFHHLKDEHVYELSEESAFSLAASLLPRVPKKRARYAPTTEPLTPPRYTPAAAQSDIVEGAMAESGLSADVTPSLTGVNLPLESPAAETTFG